MVYWGRNWNCNHCVGHSLNHSQHGDIVDLLEAADYITAKQDRYRSESLVAQGFAESENPSNPDEPPKLS